MQITFYILHSCNLFMFPECRRAAWTSTRTSRPTTRWARGITRAENCTVPYCTALYCTVLCTVQVRRPGGQGGQARARGLHVREGEHEAVQPRVQLRSEALQIRVHGQTWPRHTSQTSPLLMMIDDIKEINLCLHIWKIWIRTSLKSLRLRDLLTFGYHTIPYLSSLSFWVLGT